MIQFPIRALLSEEERTTTGLAAYLAIFEWAHNLQ